MPDIKEILDKNKTIAMIGVSKDPKKPSTIVMKYMQEYGFKVIPVNPRAKGEKILGEEVFEKITDIKEKVEIVDVFRPSKEVYAIAEDAVKIGAKVLWLQLGIRDEKAKELVEKNDIEYVKSNTDVDIASFSSGNAYCYTPLTLSLLDDNVEMFKILFDRAFEQYTPIKYKENKSKHIDFVPTIKNSQLIGLRNVDDIKKSTFINR